MGTVDQPSKLEQGLQFWQDKEGVQIFEGGVVNRADNQCALIVFWRRPGVNQVFKHYMQLSSKCCTVALRDFYPGRLAWCVKFAAEVAEFVDDASADLPARLGSC